MRSSPPSVRRRRIVIVEARRLGAGWTDGPGRATFLSTSARHSAPAWASSTRRCWKARDTGSFVDREQLRRVLSVLLPAMVYVLAIQFLGIYVASAIYIAIFMIVLGVPSAKGIFRPCGERIFFLMLRSGLRCRFCGSPRAARLPRYERR
jgi:hypothetical protein